VLYSIGEHCQISLFAINRNTTVKSIVAVKESNCPQTEELKITAGLNAYIMPSINPSLSFLYFLAIRYINTPPAISESTDRT
jgi:hypothetical protein